MTAREQDDESFTFSSRLQGIYSEQVAGLRDGLNAVNRNVLLHIAEGRDRADQIDAAMKQLGVCANELGSLRKAWDDFKSWQRIFLIVGAAAFLMLFIGMAALLVKVF